MIDPATGQPVTRIEDGVPVIVRGAALVETMSGNAGGLARKSRLAEIMFGETLMAGDEARTAHPNPPAGAPNHATMLNAAEKRVMTEWMDLGGQYYNDPSSSASGVRTVTHADQATFDVAGAAGIALQLRASATSRPAVRALRNRASRTCATASCSPAIRTATTTSR